MVTYVYSLKWVCDPSVVALTKNGKWYIVNPMQVVGSTRYLF